MSIFNSRFKQDITSSVVESALSAYENIESLEEGVLQYKTSMVPVHARNTTEGTKYLVEYDMLKRLDDFDVDNAFYQVCDENSISYDDTYVVIPDNSGMIEDIKISESVYLKSRINDIVNDIRILSEANINTLTLQVVQELGFVSKEVKNVWKKRGEGLTAEDRERSMSDANFTIKLSKNLASKLFDASQTVADYKFTKSKISAMLNQDLKLLKVSSSTIEWFENMIQACDDKIAELKPNKNKEDK